MPNCSSYKTLKVKEVVMTNEEHLKQMQELDSVGENDYSNEHRKVKALEIIAETLIITNKKLDVISDDLTKLKIAIDYK